MEWWNIGAMAGRRFFHHSTTPLLDHCAVRSDGAMQWLGHGRDRRRQRKDFVKLAVNKLDRDLHASQSVLAGKINGLLRVLEIESVVVIGGPVPQCAEIKAGARVL